jgi:Reverse transcriptase (RNA-dependent DNA polymerase)
MLLLPVLSMSLLSAFAWWAWACLKRRNRIIGKVKQSKYWLRTHKFGIEIPRSPEHALELDAANGNHLWRDAMGVETTDVRPAFEKWEKSELEIPKIYQKIRCHRIFDIKLGENFRRKARFGAGGHTTETASSLTYSSVVSRDSVCIALLIAALNGLDLKACDIQNEYLTSDCRKKIYTIAGAEFGSEKGSIFIVKKALYGLKSSGAAFRSLLSETLQAMGYTSTRADLEVYIRKSVKDDGSQYYKMVLCYVDDILVVSQKPFDTMDELKGTFKLKGDKVEAPDMYLGA